MNKSIVNLFRKKRKAIPLPATDTADAPREFVEEYDRRWNEVRELSGGIDVYREFRYDGGDHPKSFVDHECEFAARHIKNAAPKKILDVGSYRGFIIGMLAHYDLTTLDVRDRKAELANETVLTCDAKQIPLPDASFDAVVSLCAVEHLGLGRYGDAFDIDGDTKSFREMIRILKPGGLLIFTTTINGERPAIAFNAHRIYTPDMLRSLCGGCACVEEKFFSHRKQGFCDRTGITSGYRAWDVYLGCWKKN